MSTKPVSISGSTPPTLQIAKTDATCGSNNGIITATATGGSGQYSYSIDGINYQAANVFNNLPAR